MNTTTFFALVAAGMVIAALVIIGAGHIAEVIIHGQTATYAY